MTLHSVEVALLLKDYIYDKGLRTIELHGNSERFIQMLICSKPIILHRGVQNTDTGGLP